MFNFYESLINSGDDVNNNNVNNNNESNDNESNDDSEEQRG